MKMFHNVLVCILAFYIPLGVADEVYSEKNPSHDTHMVNSGSVPNSSLSAWYTGIGFGFAEYNECTQTLVKHNYQCNEDSDREINLRMYGGYEQLEAVQQLKIGIEAGYADLGNNTNTLTLDAILRLPIDQVNLFGTIGMAYVDQSNSDGAEAVYGLGIESNINSRYRGRVQWRKFDELNADEFNISLMRFF